MDGVFKFLNFISKFVGIVNKEKAKLVTRNKTKLLTLDAFKLKIIKQMDKYRVKKIKWTKKRKNFFAIFLNFCFFWSIIIEVLDTKLERTELFDNLYLELTNFNYITYFGFYFQKEIESYHIIYLLNQIVFFNKFYKIYYNFISLYTNENLDMLKNFNYLKILSENKIKIDGKILEIVKTSTIKYSPYKRYFRNEREEEVNLDTFEHEIEEYIENDPVLQFWYDEADYLPYNLEELSDKYGFDDEEQIGQKENGEENEKDYWEDIYGPKGFYDLRFLYSTLNRLRREEKLIITDPFFYSVIFDKLNINFYLFDEITLRILEIFLFDWKFFYFDNFVFNQKWEQINDLIFSKSIFQLKIDLETFLSLTKFLSFFRNHMYDKYIYTHDKLCDKLRYRLLYINNIRIWFKQRAWWINLEYIKQLKNKAYFIFKFKKEYHTVPLVTYEENICNKLYKDSFLKHSKIINKNFIKILNVITKKSDFFNLNLMFYKILCENPQIFCIEEWLIYHYENIYKYLFFFEDEKYLMWETLIEYNEKIFLYNLLYDEYIYKFHFVIDFFIFGKPLGIHYIFFLESKIFIKFYKIGVIRFILKKLRFRIYYKWGIEEYDKKIWYKWFLKGFKFFKSALFKLKKIDIELIDYFVFWITRLHRYRHYNLGTSVYDFIYNSRYLSNLFFCKKLFEKDIYTKKTYENSMFLVETDLLLRKGNEPILFNLNEYWVLMFYKDLILNLIISNFLLNILFFFIFEKKYKKNLYELNKYFLIRHYGWNDVKKINI